MEGIFVIIGVILGFYLAKYPEINRAISEKVSKEQPKWGEPFIVRTDEAKLEREQKAQEQKEPVSLEDYLKEQK